VLTVNRPPGKRYAQDAEFALKVQQMKNQQLQASAAANAKALDDFNRSLQKLGDSFHRNTPKSTFINYYDTFGGGIICHSTTY
jgi:hypothetical protein